MMHTEPSDRKQQALDALSHHPRRGEIESAFDAVDLSEPEMLTISILVCALVITRGAELAQLRTYVAEAHDQLPFEGCERLLFDTVIAALCARGHTTDEIADFLESHALLAGIATSIG